MEPKFIKKETTKIAGFSIMTTMKDGKNTEDIPRFWQNCMKDGLMQKLHKEAFVKAHDEYGLCIPGRPGSDDMEYMIGVEVKDDADIPEGYRTYTIPCADFAVFYTPPSDDKVFSHSIQKLWIDIFEQWLPGSGCKVDESVPSFELYNESCKAGSEMVCAIYFHVQ
jgi:AraC family transcriptional regulator